MDIQAEKLALIQWLLSISDEKLIDKIKALKGDKVDWWDEIPETTKEAINEGLDDLKAGRKKDFDQVIEKHITTG